MFSDAEITVFMEELDDKIQIISDNLLVLEKEGEKPEILQEIFRAAHTIKGSSALMGYEKMSTFTHEIENLFDRLRQQTLPVTPSLIDTLFEALDILNDLRKEITSGEEEVNPLPVLNKIRAFNRQAGDEPDVSSHQHPGVETGTDTDAKESRLQPLLEAEESVIREAELQGFCAYWITVLLNRDSQMKEVRAFLVFETLKEAGEIIKCDPPAEDLQNGKFNRDFTIILLTQEDPDRIRNLVLSIADIEDVTVKPVQLESEDNTPAKPAGEGPGARRKESRVIKPGEKEKSPASKTVRIDVQKLDSLMNLVGELVIDRTRLDRFVEIFENQFEAGELAENIMDISNHLAQITTDLQDEIMKARLLPIAYVFNRLPRMVRDIAHKMNKEVEFHIEGKETELDRNVIEVISDPLIHLLRNSIDHGIEPPGEREKAGKPRAGRIELKAAYLESHIVITLQDDGRGMDPEKIRQKIIKKGMVAPEQAQNMSNSEVLDFIFTPGFSTTENVNDISGRGVGMDIVRSQIEQINGSVDFRTVPGEGTTFTIKLPLTLAIIRALMVTLGEHTYAFPLTHIVETLSIEKDQIRIIGQDEVTVVRGSVLPLVRLANIFNQQSSGGDNSRIYVVVLGSGDKKVGVIVDHLLGEQEIVIKSLGSHLGQIENISGATILGDGKVALIVDSRGIIKTSGTVLEDSIYAEAN